MIDPSRDTVISTTQGARLTISAGAFGEPGGEPIRLEVKEAYTFADIIKGRLITTTHGQPLSSGGMIYINIAGKEPIKLLKPIKVALPTKGLKEGMQLYKGVADGKGQLDWVDPKPLIKTSVDSDLAFGKRLFMSNCASCHALGTVVTAPPLGWICDREPDIHWLHNFIRNNTKFLAANDPYACYLYNLYGEAQMNRGGIVLSIRDRNHGLV